MKADKPKEKHAHTSANKSGQGDWHVSHTSLGMGDYYGTGVRAKIGKMRQGTGMEEVPPNKLKTPPRSVA